MSDTCGSRASGFGSAKDINKSSPHRGCGKVEIRWKKSDSGWYQAIDIGRQVGFQIVNFVGSMAGELRIGGIVLSCSDGFVDKARQTTPKVRTSCRGQQSQVHAQPRGACTSSTMCGLSEVSQEVDGVLLQARGSLSRHKSSESCYIHVKQGWSTSLR